MRCCEPEGRYASLPTNRSHCASAGTSAPAVKELEYEHFVTEGAMLVTVHRYRVYDISIDDYRTSTRMATAEKIAKIGGEIIPRTAYPLDANELDDGWTEKVQTHFGGCCGI
jgi:hypothetical protein